MRKLLLSVAVVAASAAYVAERAATSVDGVQGLLDRVAFRTAKLKLPPFDLGGASTVDPSAPPPPLDLGETDSTPAEDSAPGLGPHSDLGVAQGSDTQLALAPGPGAATDPAPAVPADIAPAPATPQSLTPPLPHLSPRDCGFNGGGRDPRFADRGPRAGAAPTSGPTTSIAPPPPPVPAQQIAQAAPSASPNPAPSSPSPAPAPKPASGQYRDGSYTGSLNDAYYGVVQVKAEVQGGKLTGVDVLSYPSDRSRSRIINGYALPKLQSEVVRAQGTKVDLVSGATLTQQAYLKSLGSALQQAE